MGRGQLGIEGLLPTVSILAVSILAISLIAGVVSDVKDTNAVTFTLNESTNYTTATATFLNYTLVDTPFRSVNSVKNQTGNQGTLVEGTDWTLITIGINTDGAIGIVQLNASVAHNNSLINISYNVYNRSESFNISNSGLLGLKNTSNQFPNIGTVIGIVVIITLLAGAFAFLRR